MRKHLKRTLNTLYDSYVSDFRRSPEKFFVIRPDPIIFPRRYHSFEDQEAAGFLAATFAYGRVSSLCRFVGRLLEWLGPSPAASLKKGNRVLEELRSRKPYYRLHKSEEILALLNALSGIYSTRGSLYAVFMDSYTKNHHMQEALSGFVATIRSFDNNIPKFLVPSPQEGSTCKRLNLFLRWMVRRHEPDLNLWKDVSPSDLLIPVDTHIGRIAYRLGWIRTPSLTWQKVETITSVLRRLDPGDPTRYDFALCHESIAKSLWLQQLLTESERTARL